MRIGYPCMNYALGFPCVQIFRLKSYSVDRLITTVQANLDALAAMTRFNIEHDLLFFRISSQIVPFASHPVCQFDWLKHFAPTLKAIGESLRSVHMRISMHPDQFTLINSPDPAIYERSRRELDYHAQFLDALELDVQHKIQIHVGGVYGDKEASLARFEERYRMLSPQITRRLVIENDDRLYNLDDCWRLHNTLAVPILFDTFHHEVLPNGLSLAEALQRSATTWRSSDGPPMIDYSSQRPGERRGNHDVTLDPKHFRAFLKARGSWDGDVMLEIKDKEKSAILARQLMQASRTE